MFDSSGLESIASNLEVFEQKKAGVGDPLLHRRRLGSTSFGSYFLLFTTAFGSIGFASTTGPWSACSRRLNSAS